MSSFWKDLFSYAKAAYQEKVGDRIDDALEELEDFMRRPNLFKRDGDMNAPDAVWDEENTLVNAELERSVRPPVTGVGPEDLGIPAEELGIAGQGLKGCSTTYTVVSANELGNAATNTPPVEDRDGADIQR